MTWVEVPFGLFFFCAAGGGSKATYRYQAKPDGWGWKLEAALSFATFVGGLALVINALADFAER